MTIYDDFIQFGDDQDLFDKWGCNVCGGRAPTDCQGVPADDVHHEPYCPMQKFMDALWKMAQLEAWAADPSLPVFLRRCYQSCADTLRGEFP